MKQLLLKFSWFALFLIFLTYCDSDLPVVINPELDTTQTSDTSNGETGSTDTSICFERDILPIFRSSCAISGCHDNITRKEGLDLTRYETIIRKGIKPYNPSESKIYKVLIEDDEDDRMPPPPYPRLSQDKITKIYRWIAEGAKNTQCDTTTSQCETQNMSYARDIQPILSMHCVGCHSSSAPSGGVILDNYNSVRQVASSGRLVGAITHQPGYKPMPQNGKLDSCSIQKIISWVNNGMPPIAFEWVSPHN